MKNIYKNNRTLTHANKAMCGNNNMTVQYLKQVQKCIAELDQMGLHVINVYFEKIKPSVRVQPCQRTTELQKEDRAICYIKGHDGERYDEYQMMVQGIKVIWRSYLH